MYLFSCIYFHVSHHQQKTFTSEFPQTTVGAAMLGAAMLGAAMLGSTAKEIHNYVHTYIPICVPH